MTEPLLRIAQVGKRFGGFVALDGINLDALAEMAPAILTALAGEASVTTILLGWSASWGRALGYAFAPRDGFKPQALTHGHAYTPSPIPGTPGYAAVNELSLAAAEGWEVETFHKAFAACQMRAYRSGRYHPAFAAGGELHLAEVGRDGVTWRVVGKL